MSALQVLGVRFVQIVHADSDDVGAEPEITVVRDIDNRYLPYLAEQGLEAFF